MVIGGTRTEVRTYHSENYVHRYETFYPEFLRFWDFCERGFSVIWGTMTKIYQNKF